MAPNIFLVNLTNNLSIRPVRTVQCVLPPENTYRIAKLEESPFEPLEDELQAEQSVNRLLIAGFIVPIATAFLQTALAYLYFQYGHPWSRVLKQIYAETPEGESQGLWTANPLFKPKPIQSESGIKASMRVKKSRSLAKGTTVRKSMLYSQ